ncbi:tyrosine-type recombinase/integrase [Eubacterium callanderi]|uniref:tyrosine-type recombinase/integrase n=1 Tax=Eubacterium callanderi TaxID=53442 RepID=UPI0022E0FF67|nr:tyrosine-type recombinase/integrase [Eubacterium callanderi]
MVAGHLEEKNGLYYCVISYYERPGKRIRKWISTGLRVKGNKKKAEKKLLEVRSKYIIPNAANDLNTEMLFGDYLRKWLEYRKSAIAITTYHSYKTRIERKIAPYFDERKMKLGSLKAAHAQEFYIHLENEKLKPCTIKCYHELMNTALNYAVRSELILANPLRLVYRPAVRKSIEPHSCYNELELEKLFKVSEGTLLEIPILLGAFYGLRRSEIIGLKWSAVDFENNLININHTIVPVYSESSYIYVKENRTKTISSRRTLPLIDPVKGKLIKLKAIQLNNRLVCGNAYEDTEGYICVNEVGRLYTPNWLTTSFGKLLKKHGLRHIRFHDLRHSCASILLRKGVQMKYIQEWLGHSNIATTADIYSHLEVSDMIPLASTIEKAMQVPDNPESSNLLSFV